MNIMIVVPWDQKRGGVATVVNKLAKYLSERGHSVTFLHPGNAERPLRRTTHAGAPGIELNLRNPFIPEHPWRSRAAFWLTLPRTLYRLQRLTRELEIDLVSVHYPLQSFVYFVFCRWLLGTRLVISVHGTDLMPIGEYPPRRPRALQWLLRSCDLLTAPSQHYLDDILIDFPQLRERALAIHNGIDVEEYQGCNPPEVPPAETTPEDAILCIAAHNSKKAIDVLLQALALVRSRGVDLKLTLVGDGPLRSALELQAEQLGIADQVRFTGPLELPAVKLHLQRCRLFVLPSRDEPFGIAILEAMAHGKPVIATRVGGIPEIISHLENGLLVPPDDPQALAAAICTLHNEPALRDRLSRRGMATVLERFTYQHTGARFESLFSELVT